MMRDRCYGWTIRILLVILWICVYSPPMSAEQEKKETPQYQKPYKFSSDWFSHNIPKWKTVLWEFTGRPNLDYLEIGVFEGRSFIWMLENILTHPSAKATAVDIFPEDLKERFVANLNLSGSRYKVTILKGTSQTLLRRLPLESFDIIYIDGSHLAKYVYLDAALSWDLLKKNGLLIFDDYLWSLEFPTDLRPKISIDTFLTAFGDELEVVHKDYQVVVRKKVPPCKKLHCSSIGNYGYAWYERALYDLKNYQLVQLSEQEKLALERFLRSYVDLRHNKVALLKFIKQDKDFLTLQKKIRLLP